MAIGPERMEYFKKLLRKAIDLYYGDRVPDLGTFKNRRRKTFMQKLEEEVNATEWRQKIAESVQARGTKQGVVTRLQNERQAKRAELEAVQMQEIAELKAKHQRQQTILVAHYEPKLLEANDAYKEADHEVSKVKRASYYAGMKSEDDGESFYNEKDIDVAIRNRVDGFMEMNLGSDEEGLAVLKRVKEEEMISDLAYISEKVPELREAVLEFVRLGKLPPITIEAWRIENGVDLSAN
jgi:hypothetical protein